MSIQSKLATIALSGLMLALGGCATQSGTASTTAGVSTLPPSPASNALALVAGQPELSTFTLLVKQAGLDTVLQGAGAMTVFAPTNDAFKAVPTATLDKLTKDPEFLKTVLSHHILASRVRGADVEGAKVLTATDGGKLSVARAGDFLTVDEGLVTEADLACGNGVVHVVDTVLLPPKK